MVDWTKAAVDRLARAEAEVRSAESELGRDGSSAQSRYASAKRELERARRFLNRISSENAMADEGTGLFG